MSFAVEHVGDQKQSLERLAGLVVKGSIDPVVVNVARTIVADCDSRDDLCEVTAIFDAVHKGTDKVPALRNGIRYVKDPRAADFFQSARRVLENAAKGANRADCDEHAVLVATLCAALGFKAGVRAYGSDPKGEYTHVYAVVAVPKDGPWPAGYGGHGMDTTVPEAFAGWQPSKGRVLTYWVR